jgi:pimeloyl-ACP methyl ester carboxylesterase
LEETVESLAPGAYTARIGDIDMYYEVRGSGLLMLVQNGIWGTSFADRATVDYAQCPPEVEPGSVPHLLGGPLAERFTVLEMDGRGTGRTTLGRGPANYGRYADDTIRLLDHLDVESAHLSGTGDRVAR